MHYFDNFKNINYSNTICKNILSRAKILEKVATNSFAFYEYQIKNNERPDKIANGYYDDPYFSWLVYLSNNIIDPYYGWQLDQQTFQDFIVQKYGSSIIANRKIIGWRPNWDENPSILSPGQFNILLDNERKYWRPIIGFNSQITGYERAQDDWLVDTNYYQQIYITDNTDSFATGDLVSTLLQDVIVSKAEIYSVHSNNSIIIHHIVGNPSSLIQYSINIPGNLIIGEALFATNGSSNADFTLVSSNNTVLIASFNTEYLTGNVIFTGDVSAQTVITNNVAPIISIFKDDSNGNSSVMTNSNTIARTIPLGESAYWSPWYSYEMEDENNTKKQNIKLLDSAYKNQAMLDLVNINK